MMVKIIIISGFLIFFSSMSSCERHGDAIIFYSSCEKVEAGQFSEKIKACEQTPASEYLRYEGVKLNEKICYSFGAENANGALGANYLFLKKEKDLCEYKFLTYTFGTRESGYGAVSDQGGGGYQFKMDVIKLKPLFAPKGKWIDENTEIIKLNSKKEILDFIQN